MTTVWSNRRIRLQFVLGAGLSSRLIAWYGQGYGGWSHVDCVLANGLLVGARSDKIAGVPPGIQARAPGYEDWIRSVLIEIPGTESVYDSWERNVTDRIGDQYSQQSILNFITGRYKEDKGRWICSAFATEELVNVHVMDSPPIPASQVTPDALHFAIIAGLGGKVKRQTGIPLAYPS